MAINPMNIPAERLALLDTATLYPAPRYRNGEGAGQYSARELAHVIATGEPKDSTPPGCTIMLDAMEVLNDGPWRDDAHRTETLLPYLGRMLAFDPEQDEHRRYAAIDHILRTTLPEVCDALKLDERASALRALAPIVDHHTLRAGRSALDAVARSGPLAGITLYDVVAPRHPSGPFGAFDARTAWTIRIAVWMLNVLQAIEGDLFIDAAGVMDDTRSYYVFPDQDDRPTLALVTALTALDFIDTRDFIADAAMQHGLDGAAKLATDAGRGDRGQLVPLPRRGFIAKAGVRHDLDAAARPATQVGDGERSKLVPFPRHDRLDVWGCEVRAILDRICAVQGHDVLLETYLIMSQDQRDEIMAHADNVGTTVPQFMADAAVACIAGAQAAE